MTIKVKNDRKRYFSLFTLFVALLLILILIGGCSSAPSEEELAAVDYTPQVRDDWEVSTPKAEGLDPMLVAEAYYNASQLETIYSMLVVKNGRLIAEKYFHAASATRKNNVQSVTKSITSALVGIALEKGCLTSVDQKMMDFFPELAGQVQDSRKNEITIRQLLQMRAGYAWEESTPELFELFYTGFRPSTLLEIPLTADPGTRVEYSNISSHLLGIVVARACDTDLRTFAEENLFAPLGISVGHWEQDWEGYYLGYAVSSYAARDLAKFGLMYLNEGVYNGVQVVPSEWVRESLEIYSDDAWPYSVGANFKDISYGYQWWNIKADDHRYNLAWGHGGQQIALVHELDIVIVVTADDLHGRHGDDPWALEKANLNLVADFIASLPGE